MRELLSASSIARYRAYLQASGIAEASIVRKISSVHKYAQWAQEAGYLSPEEFRAVQVELQKFRGIVTGRSQKSSSKAFSPKKHVSSFEAIKLAIAHRFNAGIMGLFLLIAFSVTGGIAFYNQFFSRANVNLAYPTAPVSSSRKLNFQGLLTDASETPITSSTNMRFRLYNASSGGSTLYDSGTCSIQPDTDGIVNVLVGSSCGAEIEVPVFTNYGEIWLGVTVGADAEMTPRQQIANVPYAINSETLQGLPPGTGKSTIAYINDQGDLLISTSAAGIRSVWQSTTFQISSANAVTIASAGSGDITLNATESGTIKLQTNGTTGDQVSATNANLATGNLIYGSVNNDATGFNLLQLQSGSSPTTKFQVDYAGNTTVAGSIYLPDGSATTPALTFTNDPNSGLYRIGNDKVSLITGGTIGRGITVDPSGNVGIGSISPSQALEVAGNITLTKASNPTFLINSEDGALIQSNGQAIYFDIDADNDGTGGLFQWRNNASSALMTLLEGGNVGIGTTAPTSRLKLGSSAGSSIEFPSVTAAITSNAYYAAGWKRSAAGYATSITNYTNDGSFQFSVAGTSTADSAITWTDVLKITNAGNVGIGSTAPTQVLDIVGNMAFTGALMPGGNAGISGYFLISQGAGSAPTWTNSITANSLKWNALTDPDGNLALNMTTNTTTFNWDTGTGASDLFNLTSDNSANGTGALLNIQTGTTSTILPLRIRAGATEALAVQTDGNVGVGTITSSQKLQVQGNARITGALYDSTNAAGSAGYFLSSTGTGTAWTNSITASALKWNALTDPDGNLALNMTTNTTTFNWDTGTSTNDLFSFTTDASSNGTGSLVNIQTGAGSTVLPLRVRVGTTEALMVSTAGNVGVGTTSPLAKLHVNTAAAGPSALIVSDGTNYALAGGYLGAGVGYFGGTTGSQLALIANSSEKVRITTSGNVGIGSTVPTALLDIAGTASTSATLAFRGTTDPKIDVLNGENLGIRTSVGGDTGLSEKVTILNSGNVGIGSAVPLQVLDVNGDVKITGNDVMDSGNATRITIGDTTTLTNTTTTLSGTTTLTASSLATFTTSATLAMNSTSTLNATSLANLTTAATLSWGGATTVTFTADNATINGSDIADGDLTLQGTSNATRTSSYVILQPTAGNVGIGSTTPLQVLDVNGDVKITGNDLMDSTNTSRITLGDTTTLTNTTTVLSGTTTLTASSLATITTAATVDWGGVTTLNFTADNATINGSDVADGDLTLQGTNNATRTTSYVLLQPTAGNVGIGSATPLQVLDVNGDVKITGNDIMDSGNTSRVTLGATTTLTNTTTILSGTTTLTASSLATFTTAATLAMNSTSTLNATSLADFTTAAAFNWGGATSLTFTADNATINGSDVADGDLTLQGTSNATRTSSYVILQPTAGNVGIGSSTPGQRLDVTGNVQFSGALMPGGSAGNTGEFLISQGAGSAPIWTNSIVATSVKWNSIINPDGNLSLTMGTNLTTFNWATGTSTNDLFSLTTDASANGTGSLLNIQTGASSTVLPLRVRAGAVEALAVSAAGNVGIGSTTALELLHIYDNIDGSGVNNTMIVERRDPNTPAADFGNAISFMLGRDDMSVSTESARIASYATDIAARKYNLDFLTSSGGSTTTKMTIIDNGNVGIGTTSPIDLFHVYDAIDGSGVDNTLVVERRDPNTPAADFGNAISFMLGRDDMAVSTESGRITTYATDIAARNYNMDFVTTNGGSASTKMTVMGNGNVGIGTTVPADKLHVAGNIKTSEHFIISPDKRIYTSGGVNEDWFIGLDGTSYNTMVTGFAVGNRAFQVKDQGGNVGLHANYGGNVGVGTTAPSQLLHVQGNARITGALYDSTNAAGPSGHILSSTGTGTAWTEAAGIGIRWSSIIAPTANLTLGMSTYTTAFSWQTGTGTSDLFSLTTDASANGTGALLNLQTGAGATVLPLRVRAGAVESLMVSASGNVGIGTTSPVTPLHIHSINTTAGGLTLTSTAGTSTDRYQIFPVGNFSTMFKNTANGDTQFADSTGGVNLVINHSTGNVGIGTSTASGMLEVGDTTAGAVLTNITNKDTGTASYAALNLRNDSAVQTGLRLLALGTAFTTNGAFVQDAGVVSAEGDLSGGLSLMARNASGVIRLYTGGFAAGNERMRISSDGNVGIGADTTPDALFSVGSTSQFRINTAGEIAMIDAVAHTLTDNAGNLLINSNGTKVEIADDLEVTGNDIIDSGDATRITLGATTTLTNTTTTLSGTTTLTASGLTTFTTAAALSWGGATTVTFTADNATINGSDADNGNLVLRGTSSAIKTTSYLLLQDNGGNVGVGSATPGTKFDVTGDIRSSGTLYGRGGLLSLGSTGTTGGWQYQDAATDYIESYNGLRVYTSDRLAANTGLAIGYGVSTVPVDSGGAIIAGNVGIGTATAVNDKLTLYGTASNAAGPHVRAVTSTDAYPVFYQLNWSHDNIALNFDAYYDAGWKSSDAGSNFQIYKLSDALQFRYESGIAAGNVATFATAFSIASTGAITIGDGVGTIAINSSDWDITTTGVGTGFNSITSTTFVGALTGNATTASALAADPANCAASSFPLGIAANGSVQSCSTSISGNAATATTATNANNVNLTNATANASYYVTLSDAATGNQTMFTDATLRFNPSTNVLSNTTFSGALSGNATTASALAADPANCAASSFPLGIAANGSVQSCSTSISGNAATATTATSATSATSATTATNANNVNLTNATANGSYYVTLSDAATGNQTMFTDATLRFNPSTNAFSAGAISGTSGTFSSTLTLSGTGANVALGSNWLSGDGGDEGVFVTSNGNVGIGTSTITGGYRAEINGQLYLNYGSSQNIRFTTPGGLPGFGLFNGANPRADYKMSTTALQIGVRIDGQIPDVGMQLGNRATSWGTWSDERLKTIQAPIENASDKLAGLRTVYFNYKLDPNDTQRRLGLIAQDVQAVFPEAVFTDDQGYLVLQYTDLIPPIISALQEQDAKIDVEGNLVIQGQSSSTYTVRNTTQNKTVTTILAGARAVVASITAGTIHTKELAADSITIGTQTLNQYIRSVIAQVQSEQQTTTQPITVVQIPTNTPIQTPKLETKEVQINDSGGSSDSANITVEKENAFAQLVVKIKNNTIARIDQSGNATFSGTINAPLVKADLVETKDASVSGTLVAKEIRADNIQALTAQVNTLQSELAHIGNTLLPLSDGYMSAEALIGENLTVTNLANVYDLSVAHTAIISRITIDGNSIGALAQNISFFNGELAIAQDGSLTTQGSIMALGGIKTDVIEPAEPAGDVTIKLNNEASSFKIQNNDKEVASIDASGSAYFAQGVDFDKYEASAGALIAAPQAWIEFGENTPAIKTNSQASGNAILPAGESEILVANTKVKANSLVYVTATTSTNNQIVYVSAKKEGAWFKVKIDQPINQDITFNWWIL